MDTSFTLTIYVDDKPHNLKVNVQSKGQSTHFHVSQNETDKIHILPDQFVIASDGDLEQATGKETVEQLQLLRLIWQSISNMISV